MRGKIILEKLNRVDDEKVHVVGWVEWPNDSRISRFAFSMMVPSEYGSSLKLGALLDIVLDIDING